MEHTDVSLKEYFEKVLAEKDKAVNIALAAAKEAVQVAEANSEKWRANANEWRGAMSDREKNFLQRAEFEAYKMSVEKALAIEKERGDKGEGKWQGGKDIMDIIKIIVLIAGFILAYFVIKK